MQGALLSSPAAGGHVMSEKQYVVSIPVWRQTSAHYDAERTLRTKVFDESATLHDVMEWAAQSDKFLGTGDVMVTHNE